MTPSVLPSRPHLLHVLWQACVVPCTPLFYVPQPSSRPSVLVSHTSMHGWSPLPCTSSIGNIGVCIHLDVLAHTSRLDCIDFRINPPVPNFNCVVAFLLHLRRPWLCRLRYCSLPWPLPRMKNLNMEANYRYKWTCSVRFIYHLVSQSQ